MFKIHFFDENIGLGVVSSLQLFKNKKKLVPVIFILRRCMHAFTYVCVYTHTCIYTKIVMWFSNYKTGKVKKEDDGLVCE